MFSQASFCPQGASMAKGVCVVKGGGMHGEGGACMVKGSFMAGGAWQERRPLQRTVRILLECILV